MGKMKETVALIRAATTVLTRRAREGPQMSEFLALRRDMEGLREENERLRREVEVLKGASTTSVAHLPLTPSAHTKRRAAAAKRRRIVESDEDSDTLMRAPPDLHSASDFPSLPVPSGEREEKRREKKVQDDLIPAILGPTLQGKARPLEPVPDWMPEKERAAFIELRDQKDHLVSQVGLLLKQMGALEVTAKNRNLAQVCSKKNAAPISSHVHSITGEEAMASNPPEEHKGEKKEAPSVVPAATTAKPQEGGKKEKKKKGNETGESQGPPPPPRT